jgi:hypothetical protein
MCSKQNLHFGVAEEIILHRLRSGCHRIMADDEWIVADNVGIFGLVYGGSGIIRPRDERGATG